MTTVLLMAFTLAAVPAAAGEFQDDLKGRRARVMARLGHDAMLVMWSAPAKVYSLDIDYEYRQDSNLYYLTGIDQEDTILVLMPGNATRKETLFIRPPDPAREHRVGHLLTREEAAAQSGIETVYLTPELDAFIEAMLARRPYGLRRADGAAEFEAFFAALADGRAKLALLLDPVPALSAPLGAPQVFAERVRQRAPTVAIRNASDILRDLRQVKTTYEQTLLERSVEISSDAHLAGMRAARPGAYEYEVEAAIEQVYLANGALGWGYPSIVGSGSNATILHYSKSSRKLEAGDLLLVDAAANYQYMTGDITRTYPVSGTFSDLQKDLYLIVLAAQDAAITLARAGNKTADIERASEEIVKAGLLKLGLISEAGGNQFRIWYTHGISHFIGIDVHDVGNHDRPLEPGMAFVIEPGIYIRESALDHLPRTPENDAFIQKVRPAVQKYRNLGVRLEDSFLLTASGLKRLSARVPRTIEEIESFMKGRPAVSAAR
jgi:Xaa-Pro aminopeptidase